jgi:hypothetical protein
MMDVAECEVRVRSAVNDEEQAVEAAVRAMQAAFEARCRLIEAWQKLEEARGSRASASLTKDWLIMHARHQRCRSVIWRAMYVTTLDRWGISCPW